MPEIPGPPLQELGLAVKRLQWRHHRAANARLAPLGLSLVQWDVLRHLDAHPDASLHWLAQLTFQTDPSMGTLAGRMVRRGLIARVDGLGRAVRHVVTEQGQAVRLAGGEVMDGVFRESFAGLDADQRSTLLALLLVAGTDPPG